LRRWVFMVCSHRRGVSRSVGVRCVGLAARVSAMNTRDKAAKFYASRPNVQEPLDLACAAQMPSLPWKNFAEPQ
jgi:hypothetical protein